MTNEERQRTMDFIVEQQARFAASMQQLEEEQIRDRPRLVELEKSFQSLARLVEKNESRFTNPESRVASLEDSSQRLIQLLENSKRKLARLESHS